MKLKYLVIVSLILAIITIGAVSASEASDELAIDEIPDDSIIESSVDEDVISDHDALIDFDIADEINTNDKSGSVIAYVYEEESYFNGTVAFSIDNTQYFSKYYSYGQYEDTCKIMISDLTLPDNLKTGTHTVLLTYLKNGDPTPYSYSKKSEFLYVPSVYPENVYASVGDNAFVFIQGLSGSSGTAALYNYDDNAGKIGGLVTTVAIVDGKARIPISGLAKGFHMFFLNMTVDGKVFTEQVGVNVVQNPVGYSASATPSVTAGSDAVVTFSSSAHGGGVYIFVDGKGYKMTLFTGNTLSESISGLTVGDHIVSVIYYRGNVKFIKNFNVNVNAPVPKDTVSLVLKTAKVKKSAKKLVLQATLKINNKVANGKKVTFKFNGKKYSAKTKKGVAKVTIKSNVLKKLKVGKKVKYQVQYLKTTAKKTAKVKK